MQRRSVVGGLVAMLTGGCIGQSSLGVPAEDTDPNTGICAELEDDGYVCGLADSISITIDLTEDDDVRYEGDGEIAYVAARSGTGSRRWETEAFESFADRTCRFSRLIEPLSDHVHAELDDPPGIGTATGGEGYVSVIVAIGSNAPEGTPSKFEARVATPRYVNATVVIADREHRCTVPVVIREERPPTLD